MSGPILVDAKNAGEVAKVTEKLLAPFDESEVKLKPAMVKGNRCLALAYIDARCVMDRLDEVLGINNWKDEYTLLPGGEVECRLSLRIAGEWITKADVGGQSEQPDEGDKMKAAYSDALKRAAVKFGIGRFLYRRPQQWMDYDPAKRQIVRPQTERQPARQAEPSPRPVSPPPPNPGVKDNLPLRAKLSMDFGAAGTREAYLAACDSVVAAVRAGTLSEADRMALRPIAETVGAKFPAARA
jgi:hypothetical protein